MLNYSIMRLDKDHVEEYCQDIKYQIESGISTMPLFAMTLTPEGDPAINKAALLCETYKKYKDRLDSLGLPSGVLIQASIGHGWKLNQASAFQKYVSFADGSTLEICCPYDKGFRKYIKEAAATIAATAPDHMMFDDDFRLMGDRPTRACACPLHMAEFNRLAGTQFTREDLVEAIKAGDELSQKYRDIFVQTQIDSLIGCSREMRAGIDSVDPTLPGSFCACGDGTEGAYEIASILSGKGNPIVVRLHNGNYCKADPRDFIHAIHRAATEIATLKGRPDVLLAETDTCPQNRYATPASRLHSQFTFTILEGAQGAKHWITRGMFEPKAGVAYRKKLAKYSRFYQELASINDSLEWIGCRVPVSSRPFYPLLEDEHEPSKNNGWCAHVLDRMGLPIYFSSKNGGVCFFDGDRDKYFTDKELMEMLSRGVVLDAVAAERFIDRGLGKYLGVDLRRREAGERNASSERYYPSGTSSAQQNVREIIPLSDNIKRYSDVCHLRDGKYLDIMFPGVTGYKNELGGTAVVFSGESTFSYDIVHAFGFLCEARKNQLIQILDDLGALPIYYPEDAEVLMKAATMPDGKMLCAVLNMTLDPLEEFPLVIRQDVKSIKRLLPDGSYENVGFDRRDDLYSLDLTAEIFDPLILIIE